MCFMNLWAFNFVLYAFFPLSSSVIHVPAVNDIQASGSSNQNLAQITRQLNSNQVAWSGNRPPFSGQVTELQMKNCTGPETANITECSIYIWTFLRGSHALQPGANVPPKSTQKVFSPPGALSHWFGCKGCKMYPLKVLLLKRNEYLKRQ